MIDTRKHGRSEADASAYEELVAAVTVGVGDAAIADRALRATLAVLGQRLTDDEARALAGGLPEVLASVVDQSEYDGDFDAAEVYERVRRRESVDFGTAKEHVEVVLRALGSGMDHEIRRRLVRALPEALGRDLLPPELGDAPAHAQGIHAPARTTLASGRPGSRHPLSEAAPSAGQTHSVATNEQPHSETKLSSSSGMTQERLRESLATGRPPGPSDRRGE